MGFLLTALLSTAVTALHVAAEGVVAPCVAAPAPTGSPLKILIAGDSITNASDGDYTWRYRFWKDLKAGGTNVDLVGRFDDTLNHVSLQPGNHQYLDCGFDQDHEARAGMKLLSYNSPVSSLNANLPSYPGRSSWINGATAKYSPDVVIAFMGTNDIFRLRDEYPVPSPGSPDPLASNDDYADKVLARTKVFVDEARAAKSDVDVVLTTVTVPPGVNGARYTLYNQKLAAAVVSPGWQQAGSNLVLAQLPSWSGTSWDGVHPDAKGEVTIAAVFDDAIHALVPSVPGRPNPLANPAVGPRDIPVLSGVVETESQVHLNWSTPVGADRTLVSARDMTTGGDWVLKADLVLPGLKATFPTVGTATCAVPCTSFVASGLVPGHLYQFRVRSAKGLAVATDIASNVVTLPDGPTLPTVGQPTATVLAHGVNLTWGAVAGATGYNVSWRKTGTSDWTGASSVTATSKKITGLAAGVSWDFAVRATALGAIASDRSPIRAATPTYSVIAAPPKPKLTSVAGHKFKATWTARTGATRYLVQLRLGPGAWKSLGYVIKSPYTSKALVKGKTYTVRVRSYDGPQAGGYSPTATIKIT